jgi:octaprenyl-diphosphate synthase
VAIIVNLEDERGRPRKPSLNALSALVGDDLEAVNGRILQHMHSPVALIPQLAGHIVAAGGKRLRPMLTLAAARLCGYRGDRHISLAACGRVHPHRHPPARRRRR